MNRDRSSRDDVSTVRVAACGKKREKPHRSSDERVTDKEKGNQ